MLDPVPVVITSPENLLMVQVPAGKFTSSIHPVATVQVGCVNVPTIGADGIPAGGLMVTIGVTGELHPASLVTPYLQIPSPIDFVYVVPVPVVEPTPQVKVHVPVAGKPLNSMDPAA